jgi:ceramide glucosyltransferase
MTCSTILCSWLHVVIFAILVVTIGLHVVTIAIMIIRWKFRPRSNSIAFSPPPISIIRPVSGLENFIEITLASSFNLNYPSYEIIFCIASDSDPAMPIVQRLIKEHPHVNAQLLIGNDRFSANPKLNNSFKGWTVAANDWIVLADSNVLMPRDYLLRLLGSWKSDTGLVCSPPAGSHPKGFWANVECSFLNEYQARWQYTADTIGIGFAQGKNMLWRREVLLGAGGFHVLGREPGEDAAFTKVMRAAALRIRLVDPPFAQPLGYRSAAQVWQRQVRWARIRRASFPFVFTLEIWTGVLLPLISGLWTAAWYELPLLPSAVAIATIWYGLEMLLARAAGWPVLFGYPFYAATRDLMLPVLWIQGWRERGFVWQGNTIRRTEWNQSR